MKKIFSTIMFVFLLFMIGCKKTITIEIIGEDLVLQGEQVEFECKTNIENYTAKWSSSNNSVATVNSNGVVTGIGKGETEIIVTINEYYFKKKITVLEFEFNIFGLETMTVGEEQVLNITHNSKLEKTIFYSSSDKNVLTVDNNGKVTAVSKGSANVIVNIFGYEKLFKINVFEQGEKPVDPDEPDNPVKPELIPLEINVPDYIGYTDLVFITANREVIWTSSNESILYVTEEGEVVILEMGVVTIRATDKNNPDAYVEKVVTITSGIAPTKLTIYQKDDNYEIKNGPNTQLLLQVKIEGPKEYDPRVTWKVSDETIATIDERGVLVPKKSGKVTVTVTSIIDNNVTGKVVITIK